MAMEIQPRAAVATGPPHYWLIEKASFHTQRWTCYRCGAQEDHQDNPKLSYSWANSYRR
jgi:hypothetical protein